MDYNVIYNFYSIKRRYKICDVCAGANFHPNTNMLPPFGMRVDNVLGSTVGVGSVGSVGAVGGSSLGGSFLLHNSGLLQSQPQMSQPGLVNGYDAPQSAVSTYKYLLIL